MAVTFAAGFGQLLAESLDVPAGREFILGRVCTPQILGPALVQPFRRLAENLDSASLAEHLVGGVLQADIQGIESRRGQRQRCWPTRTLSLRQNLIRCSGGGGWRRQITDDLGLPEMGLLALAEQPPATRS